VIVLGISAFYHDSAAALIRDGEIIAAAQQERFSRNKNDSAFPGDAITYCLTEAGINLDEVDFVGFYDKPLLTFNRLLETYLAYTPAGFPSFVKAIPVWVKEKIFQQGLIVKELNALNMGTVDKNAVRFDFHHHSHAASAFYPSPFEEAAILIMDGVGEWATTSTGIGRGNEVTLNKQITFPHSIGLLYSAFTYYLGFKINDGEYKVMGLAPYGEPMYEKIILDKLIDIKEDGSFKLDMSYFNYCTNLTMTNSRFDELFGAPPRDPSAPLTQRDMDLARSVQVVTENLVLNLCKNLHKETGLPNLCIAGGVGLNCVANGRIMREGPFENIWIQPAAGDAGASIGVALSVAHTESKSPEKRQVQGADKMNGTYLGPAFKSDQIRETLIRNGASFQEVDDDTLFDSVAKALNDEKIVGWFQGRMEFGPRALGNRSILGDTRSSKMQQMLNLKIKYRESFRPFAPAVLSNSVSEYFDLNEDSPYMLFVANVRPEHHRELSGPDADRQGLDKLSIKRSNIPAVTHVDYSARVQTVHEDTNPRFHKLLQTFDKLTGCPILVNTSFNVRDEPIVCSPEDAYRCFMGTEMDVLAIGNFLLFKEEQ
jgi:carbamoyltransferase